MANFAKLDQNNLVIEITTVDNKALDSANEEESGIAFLTQWSGGYTNWKQTSYNRKIRKNYAGIGYTYNAVYDAFIAPQPYPSWSLDENFDWQPPIPIPTEGFWRWDDSSQNWIELTSSD